MPINLRATPKGTLLQASIADDSDDVTKDRDRLLQIRNKKPLYKDGEFIHWEFPGDQIGDVLELFAEKELFTDQHTTNLINTWKISNLGLEELPPYDGPIAKSLDGKVPMEHQEKFIRFPFEKNEILLALEMGLGKGICSLLRQRTINPNGKTLVVGPLVLREKWQSEILEITGEKSFIFYGSKKEREKQLEEISRYQYVVTTFESLKEMSHLDLGFEFIIIDEAHIPGGNSQIYKSLYKYLRNNEKAHKWALSGTPMRLTIENLYDICKLISPTWAGRKTAFLAKFEKVIAKKKITRRDRFGNLISFKVPIRVASQNPELLREKLGSIMYRVIRKGIIGFEESTEIIPVPMTKKQASLYQEVLEEVRSDVRLGGKNPLVEMLRLMQMSEGAYTLFEDSDESGKMDYLIKELKNREGEKACIWFRYLPGTKKLYEKLKDQAVICTGETNNALRNYAKWAFNGVTNPEEEAEFYRIKEKYKLKFNPGEATYYIGTYSLRSGMGLNLQAARLNFFMSYDFSCASLAQVKSRIIRLSQTEDCVSYFLVSTGTIEPKTLSNILKKMENTQSVVDGEWSQTSSQTRELVNILMETN